MKALEDLRGAGLDLGAARRVESLARAFELWRAPGSVWRGRLAERGPLFSAAGIERGIPLALERWTEPALAALGARELDGAGRAPRVTALWLAGPVPTAAFAGIALPLLTGSSVYVKPSSSDPGAAELFVESLAAADPELAECAALGADPGALERADAVVASGGDESVRAVRERVPPATPFLAYAHKLSLAVVGAGADPDAAARQVALDAALWDGRGCLSPAWVLVSDTPRGAAAAFAERLAEQFEALAAELPRGALDAAEHLRLREWRAGAAVREDTRLYPRGEAPEWGVSLGPAGELPPPGGLRFARVVPLAEEDDLVRHCRKLRPHLSAIGHAGWTGGIDALRAALEAGGGSRLCPAGRLQAPPPNWRHDGMDPIRPLLRWIDVEDA